MRYFCFSAEYLNAGFVFDYDLVASALQRRFEGALRRPLTLVERLAAVGYADGDRHGYVRLAHAHVSHAVEHVKAGADEIREPAFFKEEYIFVLLIFLEDPA